MSSPTIQATNLTKFFGERPVLRDLSFEVMPGDVIGVLGKNGAGKTTLLEMILGFTAPTSGEVQVFGYPSRRMSGAAKMRIGFVPQQDELLDPLRVEEQIKLVASFYPRWDRTLVARLCADWSIDTRARIKTMSVGERQKLSIVLAFGQSPDLVVLDEPVASLDPVARRQFLEQLVELASDQQRAIVFSSHIVSDIERLANRIWILKDGRLHWQGDLDSLKESILRLHLRGRGAMHPTLTMPGLLSLRRLESGAIAVVRDWSEQAQRDLEQQIDGSAEVEAMGLEEIFLELHR